MHKLTKYTLAELFKIRDAQDILEQYGLNDEELQRELIAELIERQAN